jgi:DNA-binding MarR family transcriptional regulator
MSNKPAKPLTYHISLTASLLKTALHKRLRNNNLDVTPEQLAVLSLLSKQQDCVSMQFISQNTFRDSSAVTRLIDTLEKKELLRRVPSTTDRRIKNICLTEKGRQIFETASVVAEEHVKQSLANIEESECTRLVKALLEIQNNLTEL